jgi:hypothetical protein
MAILAMSDFARGTAQSFTAQTGTGRNSLELRTSLSGSAMFPCLASK